MQFIPSAPAAATGIVSDSMLLEKDKKDSRPEAAVSSLLGGRVLVRTLVSCPPLSICVSSGALVMTWLLNRSRTYPRTLRPR